MGLRHFIKVRTIMNNVTRSNGVDVDAEVLQAHATAKRIAANKKSARRFLVSIGMYTSKGKLKPQFR
jgi:hypothetical protein